MRKKNRLLTALLLALLLHGALLFMHMKAPDVRQPETLALQSISISLGREKISKPQPHQKTEIPKKTPEKVVPQTNRKKEIPRTRTIKKKPLPPIKKSLQKQSAQQPENTSEQIPENKAPKVEFMVEPKQPTEQNKQSENIQSTADQATISRQAKPLYQINPPPKYPRLARRRNLEGSVILSVLVDISGNVSAIKLSRSSGHTILDKAAKKAVQNWKFSPGTSNTIPVEMWVKVPVRFQLK